MGFVGGMHTHLVLVVPPGTTHTLNTHFPTNTQAQTRAGATGSFHQALAPEMAPNIENGPSPSRQVDIFACAVTLLCFLLPEKHGALSKTPRAAAFHGQLDRYPDVEADPAEWHADLWAENTGAPNGATGSVHAKRQPGNEELTALTSSMTDQLKLLYAGVRQSGMDTYIAAANGCTAITPESTRSGHTTAAKKGLHLHPPQGRHSGPS